MNRLTLSRLVLGTMLAALAACSDYEENEPVDGVTQSEAEALDDAAAMLEEQRLPADAVAPPAETQGGEDTAGEYER
jgi:hypothetical protein